MVKITKQLTDSIFKIANALEINKKNNLPFLQHVLFYSQNGKLIARLTNLETEVTITTNYRVSDNIKFLLNINNKLWKKFKSISVEVINNSEDERKLKVSTGTLSSIIEAENPDDFPVFEIYKLKKEGKLELLNYIYLNIAFPPNDVLKFYINDKTYNYDFPIGINENTLILLHPNIITFYSKKPILSIPDYKVKADRNILKLAGLFEWTKAKNYKVKETDRNYVVIYGEDVNFNYRIISSANSTMPKYKHIFEEPNEIDKNKYFVINKYKDIDKILGKNDRLWVGKDKSYIWLYDDIEQIYINSTSVVNVNRVGASGYIYKLIFSIAKELKKDYLKIFVHEKPNVDIKYMYCFLDNAGIYSLSIFTNIKDEKENEEE